MFKSKRTSTNGQSAARHRSARWPWAVLIIFAVLGYLWWAFGDVLRGNAEAGTAYMARVGCSCRFVAERSLDDCSKDKVPGAELISLSHNLDNKSVSASLPLIASATASYKEGYGCVLEEWDG